MKNFVTKASVLALTAICATGITYAIGADDEYDIPELVLTSSTPANGEAIAGLFQEETISVLPAEAQEYPEMYLEYEIQGKESGDWEVIKSNVWMNRTESGEYTQTIYGNYEMYEGVDYRIRILAWESEAVAHGTDSYRNAMGRAYINLTGTTPMYQSSPYEFVSVSPEGSEDAFDVNGILPNDTPYLTVTFSGPVAINASDTGVLLGGGAGKYQFAEIVSPDGEEYSTEWHLVFREGYLASQNAPLVISVKANDAEGRVVQGNMGQKAGSYQLYYYNAEGQYAEMFFDFGAEPRASVSSIIASSTKAINLSYYKAIDSAVVTRDGEVVAKVASVDQVLSDPDNLDSQAMAARMNLDKAISEPGLYTLTVPAGYFALGTEFDVAYQAEVSVDFTVGEGVEYSVNPAAGKVESLSNFEITYDVEGTLAVNADTTEYPYLYCAVDGAKAPFRTMNVAGKTLILGLVAEITDPDTYTLIVPTGFLTLDGAPVPNVAVEYVIEEAPVDPTDLPAVFTPAPGVVEALPTQIDFVFPDDDSWGLGSGIATIQYNDEPAKSLPDADFDWDAAWNEGFQPLGEFAGKTDAGTYTVVFPAGYFLLNDAGTPAPAMTIVYTIEGGDVPTPPVTELPAVFTPAPGVVEALPAQLDFVFTDYDSWMGGSGIATIQYNDEEPVKLPDADFDWDAAWNEGFQPLGEFAGKTDAGTYTVTFPAGYFLLNDAGIPTPAMTIVYTIEGGDTPVPAGDPMIKVTMADNSGFAYSLPEGTEASFTVKTVDEYWGLTGYTYNGEENAFAAPVAEYTCEFTVAAENDFVFTTEYTGECIFTDTEFTGTISLEGGIVVKRMADGVRVEGLSAGVQVAVYSVNGQVVGLHTATDSALDITLNQGTYIVRAGEVAVKVIL